MIMLRVIAWACATAMSGTVLAQSSPPPPVSTPDGEALMDLPLKDPAD
jgi:hypothetical protein